MTPNARAAVAAAVATALVFCGSASPGSSARTGRDFIWVSPAELLARPAAGPAWDRLADAATRTCAPPVLRDRTNAAHLCVLAKAIVFARTGNLRLRLDVVDAIWALVNAGVYHGDALALGRALAGYVIAADLIGLADYDAALDARFRDDIAALVTTPTMDGPASVVECHERLVDQWGTQCGATRAAVAAYVGDVGELARVGRVFKGWLGDYAAHAGFGFSAPSWQCHPERPVAVNPKGCTKEGRSIDGVLAEDQGRDRAFSWPPTREPRVYETLQGALTEAVILQRAGFDAFAWEDRALLRAFTWLYDEAHFPASGENGWEADVVNHYYRTRFAAIAPVAPGRQIGWSDWTHAATAQPMAAAAAPGGNGGTAGSADATTAGVDGRSAASGPASGDEGIWIGKAELASRPTSGEAWDALLRDARQDPGPANIADQDSKHDVRTLAAALVYARTGQAEYFRRAKAGILAAVGTELTSGTRWLAAGRNLTAYIIAADLLGLRGDGDPASDGSRVEAWVRGWTTKDLPDNNTSAMRRMRPFASGSNAEAQEGAAFAAVAAYLRDRGALDRAWRAFRTFACDAGAADSERLDVRMGIDFGWAADASRPCAVNPKGSTKVVPPGLPGAGSTHRVDGALINDMRRGGPYQWPPAFTQYPWTGLAGFVPAAVILQRAGYPAFEAGDRAVLRAVEFLFALRADTGDQRWFDGRRGGELVQLVNHFYGTALPVAHPVPVGHTVGYTDWTHPVRSQ